MAKNVFYEEQTKAKSVVKRRHTKWAGESRKKNKSEISKCQYLIYGIICLMFSV